MIHNRAVEIVRNILESASYDVEEGDGLIDLSAYYDDECVVVLCSDDSGKIDEFNKKNFTFRVDDEKVACRKLLFTMNSHARADNCIVWGHQDLSKFSGQAAVAYILDQSLALELKKEERFNGGPDQVTSRPTLDDYGPELPLIPSSITEERARQIAGINGEIRRIYIPHYLYQFTGSGEKQFKSHVIDFNAKESGLVNAITGTVASLEIPDPSAIEIKNRSVPVGSKILKPEKDKKAMEYEIIQSMKEKLTRNVRVSKTEGDTISYEDIEVSPGEENLDIKMELVYLPVIQIRGSKVIEIETFSGNILKEPVDDGVELL
ncbi:hypothetical protein [Methanolacinia petrolearia]|uniref:hypothetical protein n=1 Tax=Methanolacinia petrolearia TaxID=54120 RepID=UPI003BA8B690